MVAATLLQEVPVRVGIPRYTTRPSRVLVVNHPQEYSTTMHDPKVRYLPNVFLTFRLPDIPKFASAILVR